MAEAVAGEVGISVVSGVASKVTEILFDPIQREICYVFKYKSYVEKLRTKLQELNGIKQRLQQNVENAQRQGDNIFDDVEKYLVKMSQFIAGAQKLVGEEEDKVKNKRCFVGLCPNFLSRRKLSKEAVNAAEDADNHVKDGNSKLDRAVSYRPAPDRTDIMNVPRGYQEFDSRKKVFQDVMDGLKDSNVNMIGVYGMGGVGKTTLAKQVLSKVVKNDLYDEVLMAEVTENPDLKTIQDKFAYDLGLTFLQHENEFERAGHLRRRLKEKRVLVILDNIWSELNLEGIGIHFEDDEKEGKDVQRRFTVLLTSRNQCVSLNGMICQKNFHVKELSDAEAMILFWKTVDDHSLETSNFQTIADEIVRKCGGLPVAIKTIAAALKNKAIEVWRDALNRLTNSNPRDIPGMEANVYSAIELSYNILVNKEAKSLFRLCALQTDGSQIPVNDLMMYVMGSGWFKNVNRLEQARDRVHTLIDNLKSSCLLMDGDNEHVKMHDIIHTVGVSIASEENMFNIQNVDDLKEDLENVISKDATAISVNCRDIQELPQRLEYPKLNLLLFSSNYFRYLKIQNTFFKGMDKIRVLNLRHIYFPFSPPSLVSLTCLINLRTLSLNGCDSLVDVALVGELKKLEILSFRYSDIEKLPSEIGRLTRLKKLDLSYCSRLRVIVPNVISNLSQLEELCMIDSFTQWEKGEGGSNASLVELNALSQLTTLEINITDVEIVPKDFLSVELELERFKIFVGNVWDWVFKYNYGETSRTLKLGGLDKNVYLGKGVKMLLERAEDLYLGRLNGLENIFLEFSICQNLTKLEVVGCSHLKFLFSYSMVHSEGLGQLQNLVIERCESMECVINTNGLRRDEEQKSGVMTLYKLKSLKLLRLPTLTRFFFVSSSDRHSLFDEKVAFPNLETLWIYKMNELRKIWHHQLHSDSFRNLKKVVVNGCDKLMNIFSLNIILGGRFEKMESLSVLSCPSIKEIVEEEEVPRVSTSNKFQVFPQLTSLRLCDLRSLTSIYQGIHKLEWPTLKKLAIEFCPKVEILFSSSQVMNGEIESQLPLFLVDHDKVAFPNLNTLEVSYCDGLRSLATLSTIENLVKLERIEIMYCKMIEEIMQQVGEVKENSFIFSQLINLKLHELQRFKHFLGGNYTLEFPYLEKMIVSGCPNMKIFSEGVLRTPKLQKLQLKENEERWEGSLNSTIQKMFKEMDGLLGLYELILSEVPRMKEIWHDQTLPVSLFSNLRNLVVDDCKVMSSAIPTNLLRFLTNLINLTIRNCDSVEEVFHMEELNADEHFVELFPMLYEMNLINLPKLKRFYNFSQSIIELSSLKTLNIKNCPNIETFISNSPYDQPLFNEKVKFHNLNSLTLSELPKLLHLCKENSLPIDVFQNLTTSEISEYTKLEQVVPSWVSFQNLIEMEISKCDGLINLMALSTAKNMVKLERMRISDCKMIEQIIHAKEEVKKDSIIFSQLKYLELSYLSSLIGFFLGNYTLEFPSLEQVIVKECPKMEIFSQGYLSTPKLERLQLIKRLKEEIVEKDGWLWEGSLNSIIQKLFEEMNKQSSKDEDQGN